MESARASSLALPEDAWGRPWRVDGKAVLEGLFAIYGVVGGGSAILTLFFRGIVGDAPDPLRWIAIGIKLLEGLAWILLATSLWHGSQARIRRTVAIVLLLTAGSHAISFFLGLAAETHRDLWIVDRLLSLVLAPTCAALGIGFWHASEWSRRGSVLLGGAYCAVSTAVLAVLAAGVLTSMPEIGSFEVFLVIGGSLIAIPFILGPAVALTIYCTRISTRDHFAQARAAR